MGCHFLLQGIFPTQGSNPRPLQWRVVSFPLSRQGSPKALLGASDEMMLMCSRAENPSSTSSCSSLLLLLLLSRFSRIQLCATS